MTELARLTGASIGYAEPLLSTDLVLAAGEVVAVVGPNGSGKTALLRSLACQIPLLGGGLTLGDLNAQNAAPAEIARRLAVVPQFEEPLFEFTVWQLVEMGRLVHMRALWPDRDDQIAITDALERCQLSDLSEELFSRLSGGEKQRVLIARALAQQSPLLLLDEPTNHLDTQHFGRLRELLLDFASRAGCGVLLCTHELDFALQTARRVLALHDRKLVGRDDDQSVENWVAQIYGDQWLPIREATGITRWLRNYRIAESSSNH